MPIRLRRLDLVDDPEEPGNRKDCQHNQVYPYDTFTLPKLLHTESF